MKQLEINFEVWGDIPNYIGLYQASTFGRIKRCANSFTCKEKILKPCISNVGYKMVTLCRKDIKKTFTIHRLVALTFLPNPEHKAEINHKDFDKQNNCVWNLEWCTPAENNHHYCNTQTYSSTYRCVYYSKRDKRWRSCVTVRIGGKRKTLHLGSFKDELGAANAYKEYLSNL